MVSITQKRRSLQKKSKTNNSSEVMKSLIDSYEEEKLDYKGESVVSGLFVNSKKHKKRRIVTVKKCGPLLKIGVDIKFSKLPNSLDGKYGVATVYSVNPKSPADKAGIKVGDRILSIFRTIAHTKTEFSEIFYRERLRINDKKLNHKVPLCIETPCKIAMKEAKKSAERYVKANPDSNSLYTAGFKCTCAQCHDTVRFLCRNVPKLQNSRRAIRRHTICGRRSKLMIAKFSFKKNRNGDYGALKSAGSLVDITSGSSGLAPKSTMSVEKTELKPINSFSDIVNRDRSRIGRRKTVS